MPTKILIVDDDAALCELIYEVLSWNGIDAFMVTDSAQAAARLKTEKFDAVFLDLHMPAPDGIAIARQIRGGGLNQRTPIVFITGDDQPGALKRAFEAGADFLLFKPIDRQAVLRLVRATEGAVYKERRRFHRVRVRRKVILELDQERIEGMTLNMSLTGALLQLKRPLPAGTRVNLKLEVKEGSAHVRATGEVVREVGNDCVAVKFEPQSQADADRLQEFLLPLILAAIQNESADQSRAARELPTKPQ